MSPPPKSPIWITRVTPFLEVVSKSLQIVALLVGGAWALWTWEQTSAPGLGTGIQVAGGATRTWSEASQACVGELTVYVENIGQKNISVARAEYELVRAAPTRLGTGEKFKVVGTTQPTESVPLAKGEFSNSFVVHMYPPKVTSHQTLAFLFSPDQKDDVWYRVELFGLMNESLGSSIGAIDACEREVYKNVEK